MAAPGHVYRLLFIMLLPVSDFAAGWLSSIPSLGVLEPDSVEVCTSDSVNLTCTLTSTLWNSSQLKYMLAWKQDDYVIHNCSIVDETCELMLENLTLADHNLNVRCCVDSCDDMLKYVGNMVIVEVSETPTIENFMCVYHNWGVDGTLECTWSLGVSNIEASGLHATLKWRTPLLTASWTNCYDQSLQGCVWNQSTSLNHYIDVLLTVNQTLCGKSRTFQSRVDPFENVKPAPVRSVSSSVLNSTCINVSWSHAVAAHLKIYNVTLSSRWQYKEEIFDDTEKASQNWIQLICGLHPGTTYSVGIQVHPQKSGYWSDETLIHITTTDDVPAQSPQLKAGSYRWDPQECVTLAYRSVTIYWKPLEDKDKNGRLEKIVLTFDPPLVDETIELLADKVQKTVLLRCDTAYTVTVQASTEVGPSMPASVLTVPTIAHAVSQPEILLEMANATDKDQLRNLSVSWVPREEHDVTGYTVYYCHKEQGGCAKNSSIQWVSLGAGASRIVINLYAPEHYIYAVSVDTEHTSSGLEWHSCIYTKFVDPTKPPKHLEVYEASDNNALSAMWNKLDCESGQPYIQKYRLTYCKAAIGQTCQVSEEQEMSVSSDQQSTILRNLEADVQYMVKIQGVTATGARGPMSKAAYAMPVDNRLTSGNIVGIAIGSLFVVACALSGIIFMYRYCKRKMKKVLKPMKPIVPPIDMSSIKPSQVNTARPPTSNGHVPPARPPTSNGHVPPARPPTSNGHVSPNPPSRQLSLDSGYPDEPLTPNSDKEPPSQTNSPLPEGYTCIRWVGPSTDIDNVQVAYRVHDQPRPNVGQGPTNAAIPDKMQTPIDHVDISTIDIGKHRATESILDYVEATLILPGNSPSTATDSHEAGASADCDTKQHIHHVMQSPEHSGSQTDECTPLLLDIHELSGQAAADTLLTNKHPEAYTGHIDDGKSISAPLSENISPQINSHTENPNKNIKILHPASLDLPSDTITRGHSDVNNPDYSKVSNLNNEQNMSNGTNQNPDSHRNTLPNQVSGDICSYVYTSVNHTTDNHATDGYVPDIQMTSECGPSNQTPNQTAGNHSNDGYVTDDQMDSVCQPRYQTSNPTAGNHGNDGYATDEKMTSVCQQRNQMPNSTAGNHGNDGYVTDDQMASVCQPRNQMPNPTAGSHGNDGYIADEQMTSVCQPRNQTPNQTAGNHGNDGYVTDEQMTSVCQPRNQTPNQTADNHGGYVTDEKMTSVCQPRHQMPNQTAGNHGNDGYVTDEQMTSVCQPRNQMPNPTAGNHGNDGYIADEQMTSVCQPRNQAPNQTAGNHGNDGYVTDGQMTSVCQPRNQTPNQTADNHGNDGYVTDEQMTSISQPRHQTPNPTAGNHGNDGYVTDEQMTSICQPKNQTPNETAGNHGNDGYVTDEQMTSVCQPRNQTPNETAGNHGNDGYVTDEQMTSVCQPRNQTPNETAGNHGNDGYVTDEQMNSVCQPRHQTPNQTAGNHGNDGYVTDEQMTSVCQPRNQIPNPTAGKHGNDGYVADEQMTVVCQPRNQLPNPTASNHGNDGYVSDEQITSVCQTRNQTPNQPAGNHSNDGYVIDEQVTSVCQPINQTPNQTAGNHGNDGYVTDKQMT